MLKIVNLNKYFNKHKRNQIHVLKDINLDLPASGLISIVGESGSGKTTLLHSIGGLDKYEGEILYNNNIYKGEKLDLFRQDNIGVIFQNYLLFENLTVYENLEICLRIIGIKDKQEVDKRIEYVLNQVGMYKFRKKLAKNLSGGQQQRVSISRALIKKTKILLADEPTGNLDRKNTIEIMNILKQISKTTLVILITHNREMANIYSDVILNIVDGQVFNKEIETINTVTNFTDDTIYLEDFNKETINKDTLNLELYGKVNNINIKLIYKDNRYYLVSDQNINIISKNQIKEKREKINVDELSQTNYDASWYNDKKGNRTLSTFKEVLIDFLGRRNKKQRFINFSFLCLGVILAISIASFFNFVLIKDDDITYMKDKYLITNTDEHSFSYFGDYQYIAKYITNYANYAHISVSKKELDVSYEKTNSYQANFLPISDLTNKQLLCGEKVNAVISSTLADAIYNSKNYEDILGKSLNLASQDNFTVSIGGVVEDYTNVIYLNDEMFYRVLSYWEKSDKISNFDLIDLTNYDYEIVSSNLINVGNPTYVLANSQYDIGDRIKFSNEDLTVAGKIKVNNDLSQIYDLNKQEVVDNMLFFVNRDYITYLNSTRTVEWGLIDCVNNVNYKIVSGSFNGDNNSCIAPINNNYHIGDEYYIGNSKYIVTGLYEARFNDSLNAVLATKETIILNNIYYNLIYFEITDYDGLVNYLDSNYDNFELISVHDYYYNIAKEAQKVNIIVFGTLSGILLLIYVLFIYFVMRAKVLSDQYDIAVYRCLGASKRSFYAKYIKDVIIRSLFTSTFGYVICFILYILLNTLTNMIIGINVLSVDIMSFIIGLGILYLVNILIGSLPIMIYLHKTPAELVSKYDM